MSRLDEIRARHEHVDGLPLIGIGSSKDAHTDRAYLLDLIDRIAAERDRWRETVLRSGPPSELTYIRASTLSDCADELTEILQRDES